MNEWLKDHLVCPRDKQLLEYSDNKLTCSENHIYPVIEEIPIMLVNDVVTTHDYIKQTLEIVNNRQKVKSGIDLTSNKQNEIDEFVQKELPYTSGNLYWTLQNHLTRYPIPEIRLPEGNGERLLDVGCNWGRWTIAAARKGYQPIGIDPSLDAVLAARRVSQQLGVETNFVVGDARFLPFADNSFDNIFSYSVLQHFSKENAKISLKEAARVLKGNCISLIQMPNKYGIRQYQQYRRRGFTEGKDFEVRYWTPKELKETFETIFGQTKMTTDCYFGLGIQAKDVDLLPLKYKIVVYSSEILRKISKIVKPLTKVADSIYLESVNQKES